jgi:RNA polymerase primary sigma factor
VDNDAQRPGEDDGLRRYLEEIARIPPLTKDDEIRLAQGVEAGEEDARRRLIESNLRLVVAVARRFDRSRIRFADAIQIGNIGLGRAVDHYDWRKGFKFSTYATWWIRQAIIDAIRGPGSLGAT